MSLYINNKEYTSNIIIDRGLSNVDIVSTDIRPGKISIDNNGNKLIAATTEQFLENSTVGTASASDITKDKILYVNGQRLVGTASATTNKSDLINGKVATYTVGGTVAIVSGDFVNISANTVTKHTSSNTISGVALQNGAVGNIIEVVVPN